MRSRLTTFATTAAVTAALFAPASPASAAPAASAIETAHASTAALSALATKLDARLGARSAGSYLDRTTGKLVIDVTDDSAAQSVRAAGAVARTVTRSAAQLKMVTDTLDRSTKIPGTAWGVDPITNQVKISVDGSVSSAELAKVNSVAGKFGAAATVQRVAGRLTTHALGNTAGGQAIYTDGWRCSLGFNVVDSVGQHYFLTAGHCTNDGADWYGGGTAGVSQHAFLGSRVASNYPDNDFGLVKYACNPGQGCDYPDTGSVFQYNCDTSGSCANQDITSAADPFVGELVQRSGSTTGVHSGIVLYRDATVNYDDGTTVNGMVATTVCGEPGDSGGPFYDGTYALGTLSGGWGDCTWGGMMFFQPITEALAAYGVSVY